LLNVAAAGSSATNPSGPRGSGRVSARPVRNTFRIDIDEALAPSSES
jgi:hypothetical protein